MSQTTADAAGPRYAAARERPPSGTTGAWGWVKANLFSSWLSTAITLVLGYLIVRVLASFVSWAVVHAIWSVPYTAQGMAECASVLDPAEGAPAFVQVASLLRLLATSRMAAGAHGCASRCVEADVRGRPLIKLERMIQVPSRPLPSRSTVTSTAAPLAAQKPSILRASRRAPS